MIFFSLFIIVSNEATGKGVRIYDEYYHLPRLYNYHVRFKWIRTEQPAAIVFKKLAIEPRSTSRTAAFFVMDDGTAHCAGSSGLESREQSNVHGFFCTRRCTMFTNDYEVNAHWQERHKDLLNEAANRRSKKKKNRNEGLLFGFGTLLIILGMRLRQL